MDRFDDILHDLKQPTTQKSQTQSRPQIISNYDELNYQQMEDFTSSTNSNHNVDESNKLDLLKLRRNYMYLVNHRDEDGGDKTFESSNETTTI